MATPAQDTDSPDIAHEAEMGTFGLGEWGVVVHVEVGQGEDALLLTLTVAHRGAIGQGGATDPGQSLCSELSAEVGDERVTPVTGIATTGRTTAGLVGCGATGGAAPLSDQVGAPRRSTRLQRTGRHRWTMVRP